MEGALVTTAAFQASISGVITILALWLAAFGSSARAEATPLFAMEIDALGVPVIEFVDHLARQRQPLHVGLEIVDMLRERGREVAPV